ncbi:MAG TPA: molybdopterin dinucleotide binding domain-containing protein, partial [Pyrinomonadaceae bacterium]|nr:molybdopterin dinucleotide binding domain-containing protein [Pyrinomonadaceae bacterium]
AELQTRMAHDGVFGNLVGRVGRKFVGRFFGPERILDLGLRFGAYGKLNPFVNKSWVKSSSVPSVVNGLTLRKLKQAPHGIDLGALSPCLPARLRTSDKRIDLAPDVLVQDVARVKTKLLDASPDRNGDLLLIGRRQLRSNNSWMHNTDRLVNGKPRCTILMHPVDAAQRSLKPGQNVTVQSRVGSVVVPIEISEEMMPGVVSIPHGWGHDRPGIQLAVAQRHAGQSLNDVTDDQTIDALCGTAAFNGTWVAVESA